MAKHFAKCKSKSARTILRTAESKLRFAERDENATQNRQSLEGRPSGPRVAKGGDASSVWPSASHLSLERSPQIGQELIRTNRLLTLTQLTVNHLVSFKLNSLLKRANLHHWRGPDSEPPCPAGPLLRSANLNVSTSNRHAAR